MAGSIAVFALGIALLPHLHGFWGPVVLLIVAVPFIATAFIAIGIVFAQLATAESRGVAMGVYSTVLFVGLGLGPAVFAPLIQGQGFAAGFTACAATGPNVPQGQAAQFQQAGAPFPYNSFYCP